MKNGLFWHRFISEDSLERFLIILVQRNDRERNRLVSNYKANRGTDAQACDCCERCCDRF